jgi:hypothetical protein
MSIDLFLMSLYNELPIVQQNVGCEAEDGGKSVENAVETAAIGARRQRIAGGWGRSSIADTKRLRCS